MSTTLSTFPEAARRGLTYLEDAMGEIAVSQNILQDQAGSTDALGFDDGLRQLPTSFAERLNGLSSAELQAAGRSLSNNWMTSTSTALPDGRLSFFIARRFGKEGAKNHYGNLTSVDYSNTSLVYNASNYNYNAFDASTGRSDTIYAYNDQENIRSTRLTVMHNWTAMLGTHTKLEFRNLLNQLGDNRVTYRTGSDFEGGFAVEPAGVAANRYWVFQFQASVASLVRVRTRSCSPNPVTA
jgi:hypothetical protein